MSSSRNSLVSPRHREELEDKGYTVLEGVLTEEECDIYREEYKQWIFDNFDKGTFPQTKRSIVRSSYKMGHLSTSWAIRLKCKPAFAELWNTDRLLTSFDSVAIGSPPEEEKESFRSEETRWLHIDQMAPPNGLDVYQGAVYLEQADADDWTLEVLEGSHKFFEDFWRDHPGEREFSIRNSEGSSKFTPDLVQWWTDKGCAPHYIQVPKGSLVLWDSKTVHANANPVRGRAHPRWRWVLLVSMWPVDKIDQDQLKIRQQAYYAMQQTCHDLRVKPHEQLEVFPRTPLMELPQNAQTVEARRLAGVDPYMVGGDGLAQ